MSEPIYEYTLDDFRMQMGMISKLGNMRGIKKMIPGLGALAGMAPISTWRRRSAASGR